MSGTPDDLLKELVNSFQEWKCSFMQKLCADHPSAGLNPVELEKKYVNMKFQSARPSGLNQVSQQVASLSKPKAGGKRQMKLPESHERCLALKKDDTQCTKKRTDKAGMDTDLCALHNTHTPSKRLGASSPTTIPAPAASQAAAPVQEEPEEESIEVTVDAEGNYVDAKGNVYDMNTQAVVGKKDLSTGVITKF